MCDLICTVCMDNFDKNDNNCILCKSQEHLYCDECFGNYVQSQISDNSFGNFVKNNANIICESCLDKQKIDQNHPVIFDHAHVAIHLRDGKLFEQYLLARDKVVEDRTTQRNLLMFSELDNVSIITKHRNNICEKILTLSCKRCSQAMLDFTGCFCLTCNKCNANICGWCLFSENKDLHQHVRDCKKSLCPGDVFSTFDKFNECHNKRRKTEVIEYFKKVIETEKERREVYDNLKDRLKEIGIVKYDQLTIVVKTMVDIFGNGDIVGLLEENKTIWCIKKHYNDILNDNKIKLQSIGRHITTKNICIKSDILEQINELNLIICTQMESGVLQEQPLVNLNAMITQLNNDLQRV